MWIQLSGHLLPCNFGHRSTKEIVGGSHCNSNTYHLCSAFLKFTRCFHIHMSFDNMQGQACSLIPWFLPCSAFKISIEVTRINRTWIRPCSLFSFIHILLGGLHPDHAMTSYVARENDSMSPSFAHHLPTYFFFDSDSIHYTAWSNIKQIMFKANLVCLMSLASSHRSSLFQVATSYVLSCIVILFWDEKGFNFWHWDLCITDTGLACSLVIPTVFSCTDLRDPRDLSM